MALTALAAAILPAMAQTVSVDTRETTGDFERGIELEALPGSTGVQLSSGSVATSGRFADAIFVDGGDAHTRIDSDSVTISGAGAQGVVAFAYRGDVDIRSGSVASLYDEPLPGDIAEHSLLRNIYGIGVWASSAYGNVSVDSGSVATRGIAAYGIGLENGWEGGPTGDLDLSSDSVVTTGDYGIGLYARAYGNGAITIDSTTAHTTGLNSHGIYGVSVGGQVAIRSGEVTTEGDFAYGILARGGNGVTVTSEQITTRGDATVYEPTGEATGSYGIRAEGGSGAVVIDSGRIDTAGELGHGIVVLGGSSTQVTSADISTAGDWADGIRIADIADGGSIVVDSASVRTSGRDATGILVNAGNADTLIRTGAIQVSGAGSSALLATAAAADIAIHVDGRVEAAQSWAIDARANGGSIAVDVQSGQVVQGGVRLHSQHGTRVDIHGEIVGSGDHALSISGGAATINNYSNTIVGSIQLTDGNDVFNNLGTWHASGTSDFGGGTDRLVNTGLFAAGGAAPVAIAGLDNFVNEGTLDLANGRSGDRVDLGGATFTGGAGSTLLMDVDFATGTSDTLAVQAVQGISRIVVNDASTGPGFNAEGISLVESAQALDGTEFMLDLGQVDNGLVTYGLEFDPAGNRFLVLALPGTASFELIKAGAAAQDFWLRSGEAWSARMLAARDGAAAGTMRPGDGVWVQGHAGGLDFTNAGRFDLAGSVVDRDMSTESGWTGVQAGYDRVWQTSAGHVLAGATAGYTHYSLDFTSSAGSYELSGANLGAYGAVRHGRFFAEGLAKLDRFSGDLRTSEAALGGDIKGNSHGVRIEAGLRFGADFWIEPVAGVTWTRSRLDDFHAGQANASFEDATSLQTRAGLRVGGSAVVSGATLVPSLGVYAVDERRGENAAVLHMDTGDHRAIDTPHGDYARAEAALTLVAGNVEVFLRGGADFGSGTDGFDARAGLRWAW